jgi:hypothetical protein
MLKKLFFTAAAATALSVPLAGAAWAAPKNNNPPGHPTADPITGAVPEKPGIPGVVGVVADRIGVNPNDVGNALPPGQAFNELKDGKIIVDIPGGPGPTPWTITGGNTPERYASFLSQGGYVVGDKVPGGLGIKSGTPACKSGKTITAPSPELQCN